MLDDKQNEEERQVKVATGGHHEEIMESPRDLRKKKVGKDEEVGAVEAPGTAGE